MRSHQTNNFPFRTFIIFVQILPIDITTVPVIFHTGTGTHTLRSFSFMLDKLTAQYEEARSQLVEKSKEICRLEKMVWRRLEELTVNGEMMIEKIDKVTEEQV